VPSRGEFTVESPLPFDVAAGDEAMLKLGFTPTVPDQRITGTIKFTTNDQTRMTFQLDLAGQGVTAVAKPSPTTLAFGDVYVGETRTLMLTLTNAGGNALPVMGASITGSPAGVTGDFANFTNVMIASGGSATVPVTFAPTPASVGPLMGAAVVIAIDNAFGGSVTVPITGRATQSLPRMCFKFDDTGVETCTDQITTSLNVPFGALCDNTIYAMGPNACTAQNGQRTGKLYFRNEGNYPVPFSVRYRPYIYVGSRCDGGVASSDFIFSNVAVPDGGAPGDFNMAKSYLPGAESDPRPWETPPITVTYRANSACRDEAADQAQVVWSRQADDGGLATLMRMPGTLFATLTGNSLLPSAQPKTVTLGQMGQPADVPLTTSVPVELVVNRGVAPLTLTSVELWEEVTDYLPDGGPYDAGGPEGGKLQLCNPASPAYEFSDCARFQWAPGGNPAMFLPVTLDAGAVTVQQATIGRMYIGCLADGGSCPPATTRYHVYAIVNTSDPYASRVMVLINAYVRYLP
jgi:hypothetical protein